MNTARRDLGEARRSGVISRRLRRLFIRVRHTHISCHRKFTMLSLFFAFFRLYTAHIAIVNRSTLKTLLLTRVYENSREPNCQGTAERKSVRNLRTRIIAILAERQRTRV